MKPFCLLLLALSFQVQTSAAQIVRFTDSTNEWKCFAYSYDISQMPASGMPTTYYYDGDTVISGNAYQIMKGHSPLAIREDTAAKRIYFRFLTPTFFSSLDSTDGAEHLLFDYNFTTGDSLKIDFKDTHSWNVVQSVSTTLVNGIPHKVWHMESANSRSTRYAFIEGIGSTEGTAWQIVQWRFEAASQLQCFTNESGPGAITPPISIPIWSPGIPYRGVRPIAQLDNSTSCSNALSIPEEQKAGSPALPNPVDPNSVLHIPAGWGGGTLRVLDLSGRCVLAANLHGNERFPIGSRLPLSGLYIYRLSDSKGNDYTGKLIVH